MKKLLKMKTVVVLFVAVVICMTAVETFAQTQVYVYPTQLYRFRISNQNLGYLLTQYYSEGVNHGYTYEGVVGSIYTAPPPNNGVFLPRSSDLLPIHQWTVIEHGRAYTYYSFVYSAHGSNYTYDGIRGYMFNPSLQAAFVNPYFNQPPQYVPLNKVHRWYSQSKGYFYGTAIPVNTSVNPYVYSYQSPPTSGFDFNHGDVGGWLSTGYGTCPGCNLAPAPEPVPVEQSDSAPTSDSEMENYQYRMVFQQ